MTLYVITGSANTGKTGVVYDAVRGCAQARGRGLVLVPSEADVAGALRDLCADAALGVEAQPFDRYLGHLWETVGDGRRLVGPVQRRVAVREAIGSCALVALAESSARGGFTRVLEELVSRAPGRTRSPGEPARGVAAELIAIAEAYHEQLEARGLIELAEAVRLMCADPARLPLADVIGVNRFTGLTASQERFCLAVAEAADVYIALTYSPNVGATAAAQPLLERLVAGGGRHIRAPDAEYTRSAELIRIERHLAGGTDTRSAAAPHGAVRFSEAWGEEAEAARIVREVQDAVEDGVLLEEIAVVFRDPGRHIGALRAALEEAAIPASIDVTVPATVTGLGRAVAQMVSFFGGGGERADLTGFLRSRYVAAPHEAVDRLDADARRERIAEASQLLKAARRIGRDVETLLDVARRAAGPANDRTLRSWDELFALMMGNAYPATPLLGADGAADAAVQRMVLAAAEEIVRTGDRRTIAHDLRPLLDDARVALVSGSAGVRVLAAERVRGLRFRCVVIGGLVAGEFPRQLRDDATRAPAVAAALERAGFDAAPAADLAAERLLFYQAATRARDRLVLSRQVADEDGTALRTSVFVEEVLDLYRDPATGAWHAGEPPSATLTLADVADETAAPRTERRTLRGLVDSADGTEAAWAAPRLAHARHRARARGPCLSAGIAETLGERRVFTVSEIERYLQCPYRWYVESVLRPAPIDAEFGPATVGRIAHDVMKAFYERFAAETGERRVAPETLERAREVHAALAREVLDTTAFASFAEEASARNVLRATLVAIEEDAAFLPGFAPEHLEWSFGFGDDAPHDFGSFALRGRLDRVDVDEERLVVIDYKSGSVDGSQAAKFAEVGLVQLPLYAAVASARLGLAIAGGVYRSLLARGRPRGFVLSGLGTSGAFVGTDVRDEAGVTEIVADAVARAADAVAGMRAGRIPAEPRVGGACPAYCTARAVCRREGRRG